MSIKVILLSLSIILVAISFALHQREVRHEGLLIFLFYALFFVWFIFGAIDLFYI